MTSKSALALRHAVPTIYQTRDFAVTDFREICRLAGNYTGRVLKGEKPADLPVQQDNKVEFYINLKTAKTLGLNVPAATQALADEMIE
jgi:putative ABC transport system substrate-binding protein